MCLNFPGYHPNPQSTAQNNTLNPIELLSLPVLSLSLPPPGAVDHREAGHGQAGRPQAETDAPAAQVGETHVSVLSCFLTGGQEAASYMVQLAIWCSKVYCCIEVGRMLERLM